MPNWNEFKTKWEEEKWRQPSTEKFCCERKEKKGLVAGGYLRSREHFFKDSKSYSLSA